jgi:hypothetical protein
LTPAIAYGRSSCAEGLNDARYVSSAGMSAAWHEVRGERIREAQLGGKLRAEETRPEDPDRDLQSRARHRPKPLALAHGSEQRLQFEHVLGKRVGAHRRAPQREQRPLIRSRRAPEAEIDSAPGRATRAVPNCSAMTSGE